MTPAYETYDPVASVTSEVKTQHALILGSQIKTPESHDAVIRRNRHHALENKKKERKT